MSDNQFLTHNLKSAETKNLFCSNTLNKELTKINHDHAQRMRALDQEEQDLRETLRENSTAHLSRPSSSQPPSHIASSKTTTHSPKARKKSTTGACTGSPQESRDGSGSQANVQIFVSQPGGPDHEVSHQKGNADSPKGERHRTNGDGGHHVNPLAHAATGAVNSTGGCMHKVVKVPTHTSPALARRGSIQSNNSPALARRGSIQGGGSNTSSPHGSRRSSVDMGNDIQHPNLFPHRPRSNSLTASHPTPRPTPGRQRRSSLCPAPPSHFKESLHFQPLDHHRERSSSFSGIVPVRRRGSICERFGSVSERELPRGADQDRRETITSMDHLIRDLGYGIPHRELLHRDAIQAAKNQKLWNDLKNCRYLRVPTSTEHSEADD